MNYTDDKINKFLELAQEQGITKTMRQLGYPKDWSTARRWADVRGISIEVDPVKARAAATREWYRDEEVITIAQEGMNRVYEELVDNNNLTADDQKKLADALTKHYNVWANVQGRATSINESRQADGTDTALIEMLNEERMKNQTIKEKASEVI